jgi:8-oxo-dGTP pyrophosphatase MutT (NUDIX family)
MNFDEFLLRISKIKNIPLTGEVSQFKMAPPFRRERLEKHKDAIKYAKKAGVLALFYPDKNQETNFVLILRKTYKGIHSAQVSFPGGKLEANDASLEGAALRETFEEIGVPIYDIQVVAPLTQVYIPPSNFYVQPFIGVSNKNPSFIKEESEVEDIIEIPLKHFFNDDIIVSKKVITSYSVEVEAPAFLLNGHIVWGATAMILSEVKDLLKQLM